jgi:hypothetical protein
MLLLPCYKRDDQAISTDYYCMFFKEIHKIVQRGCPRQTSDEFVKQSLADRIVSVRTVQV